MRVEAGLAVAVDHPQHLSASAVRFYQYLSTLYVLDQLALVAACCRSWIGRLRARSKFGPKTVCSEASAGWEFRTTFSPVLLLPSTSVALDSPSLQVATHVGRTYAQACKGPQKVVVQGQRRRVVLIFAQEAGRQRLDDPQLRVQAA